MKKPQLKEFRCPLCQKNLDPVKDSEGHLYYQCFYHGIWLQPGFFKQSPKYHTLYRNLLLWQKGPFPLSKEKPILCPHCHRSMRETFVHANRKVKIDQCIHCQAAWLDVGELPQVVKEDSDLKQKFPTESESVSYAQGMSDYFPKLPKDTIPNQSFAPGMLLGLPSEEDQYYKQKFPLAAVIIFFVGFFLTLRGFRSPDFIEQWAFDPMRPFQNHGLNWVVSLFLHGDWFHFFGNFYFFWVVSDNIEESEGPMALLVYFFLCGFAGHLAHIFLNFQQPAIGASGAISGLLSFYALRFPSNRLRFAFRTGLLTYTVLDFSAVTYLLLFLALQVLGLMSQMLGLVNVGYSAHLGGLVMGLVLYAEKRATESKFVEKES